VEPEEAQVMVTTIQETFAKLRGTLGPPGQFDPLPAVRVFGAWMIPAVPNGAAYWGIEWYVEQSLNPTNEFLLGSRYLSTISMEPWQTQDPHFDMSLTDMMLVDDSLEAEPEVLGVAKSGLASVVSAHMLNRIENDNERRLALRHTVAHFLGRMAGIPLRRGRADVVTQHDTLLCTNTCAMRPTHSAEEALGFALEERAAKSNYCEPCQLDLVTLLTGFHYGLN
jgi:hypothetical protein